MTIFIVITNDYRFSNEIIRYFRMQNLCNDYKLVFIAIGLNEGSDQFILNKLYSQLSEFRTIENIVIFSDIGLPTKFSKKIMIVNSNIKVYWAKGSLIENGYLTYIMLNTSAPIETYNSIMNEKIEK